MSLADFNNGMTAKDVKNRNDYERNKEIEAELMKCFTEAEQVLSILRVIKIPAPKQKDEVGDCYGFFKSSEEIAKENAYQKWKDCDIWN